MDGQDTADISGLVDPEVFYREHFDWTDPREPAMREEAVRDLATRCPVTRSDAWGGFWCVNDYESAKNVFLDWETFSSNDAKWIVPRAKGAYAMPPIDADPPVQRDYRILLNPFLVPKRIAQFEPGIRGLVTELIDDFIEDGHCDLSAQFAKPFPGRMLYRFVFGMDDAEVGMVQEWLLLTFGDPTNPEAPAAQMKWNAWMHDVCERRRNEPRRDDLLDALVHATFDGQPIGEADLIGCFSLIIGGGFSTTSDSITNTMLRLAQDPALMARLHDDPSQIPEALDEFLRFDPPVHGLPRICTRDTVLNGQEIKAGERLFVHFHAANRDPDEFEDPNQLEIDRDRNRHLAFGVGPHRCIGSNVARQNLRIALEELLSRLGEFRLTPGEQIRREAFTWGAQYLPLTFTPGPRLGTRSA